MPADVRPYWKLSTPCIEQICGGYRVVCEIDGESVWFESDGAELAPSIEAFAGAMLIPALEAGAQLCLESPVDAAWLEGQKKLVAIYRNWWFPGSSVFPLSESTTVMEESLPTTRRMVASCFTGGVDSFHTYLGNLDRIDALYFVQGFDIPLDHHIRMQAFRRSMETLVAHNNKKLLILRTNLRGHHIFGKADWRKTHGAAIAAGGLVLRDCIERLLIPSSYFYKVAQPWGSHRDTDKHYSTSRVKIEHYGEQYLRFQKTAAIARNADFLAHVRVCWENRASTGNCSCCEKCLRTMMTLEVLGVLSRSTAFERGDLVKKLNNLPMIRPAGLAIPWSAIYANCRSRVLREAILNLIERSTGRRKLLLLRWRDDAVTHINNLCNGLLSQLGGNR